MITRKEIDLAAPLTTPQIEMLTALASPPPSLSIDRGCRLSGINGSTTKQLPSDHPQNGIPLCLR